MMRAAGSQLLTPRAALPLLALLAAVAVFVSVPLNTQGQGVREGDSAPRTLKAERDVQYESESLTDALRDEAAGRVEVRYFPPDPAVRQQQAERLGDFLDAYRTLRQRGDLAAQLAEAATIQGPQLTPSSQVTLLQLDRQSFDTFRGLVDRSLAEILQKPVEAQRGPDRVKEYVDALVAPGGQPSPAATLLSQSSNVTALRELLRGFVVENVKADEKETEAARQKARQEVPPVIVTYSSGQVVVPEAKTIDRADIEALRRTGVIRQGYDYAKAAGGALFALGLVALLACHLLRTQPFEDRPLRRLAAFVLVFAGALVAARFVLPSVLPDREQHYLALALPLAAPALVAAIVANLSLAAVAALAMGVLTGFTAATFPDIAGAGFVGPVDALQLVAATSLAGLAGAVVVQGPHLRRFALAGLTVALVTAGVLAVFWLLVQPRSNEQLAWLAGSAVAGGVGSALVAAGVAGLAGPFLGLGARWQLVRLAQSTHPLQRRLRDEAPGTYHHSQMVATLAERAAERIGRDGLLARVGALYHDVGKLAGPRFFIENQIDDTRSPHDQMAPAESATVIRRHVEDGLAIAREYRLPPQVTAFIPEHHGTRLVSYFYRRAVERGERPDQASFRYAGPRPQHPETAIVMLADSSEALVRAHQDRNSHIDELVDGLFAERIGEGQLDDCNLTLRELRTVAAAFKETLRAVYHPRIPYPAAVPEELARIAGGN